MSLVFSGSRYKEGKTWTEELHDKPKLVATHFLGDKELQWRFQHFKINVRKLRGTLQRQSQAVSFRIKV